MIARNLWRRGTRSLLTILGIAVGVAAVVALGTMAKGFGANYANAIGLNNDVLVTQANSYDVVFSSLDESMVERIRTIPDVTNVDPGVFNWIAVGNTPYFLVYGYDPSSVAIHHYTLAEGKPLTGSRQILLGRRAAESLKLGVDDTVRLSSIPYKIVGIYETGQGMEESGGVVTLADAQEIASKQHKVSLIQVGVRTGADIDQVIGRIENLDKELSVTKSSEFSGNEEWSQYMQGFAMGIAAIAILVGGLGMMSAMVMSVLERTREIGTLRAVGWSRMRIVRLIMGEAIGLSLVGGLFGALLGTALALAAGQIPGAGAFLEGSLSLDVYVQGLVTALVLGIVGGVYPAWTAANLQPVEALRYEGGASNPAGKWARWGGQSFRNLWRRRTRTLISAAGIGIGVATLVMLGGMIDGIVDELNGLAGSGGLGNISIMQREVADMSLSSVDERVMRMVQAMPQVESVSPFVLGFLSSKELPIFIFGGVDPNSPAMQHYSLVEGRYMQRPNEMMLGKTASESYKLGVGDTIQLLENRYKIVGLYETGETYEDAGGAMAILEAQRLLGRPRSVSFIFANVKDPAQARAVAAAINSRFPEVRATLSSEFAQSTNDLQNTDAMLGAIRMLALFVGGIVVANTMIMSIYERTREIGTLRALGWAPRRILSQVMQESLLLCLLAGLLGCVMGVLMMEAVTQIPYIGEMLSARWSLGTFAGAIMVALVLGVLGGLFPAWRASRLQPVEALRYE